MTKPDPAMLDPARYPSHCAIATRFGDLDTNKHLNNVALVSILEDARIRFQQETGFLDAMFGHEAVGKPMTMVASLNVEYIGQIYYPQPIDVHAAVVHVGRTSFIVQQLGRQENRIVSFARAVLVCVLGTEPCALPAAFLGGISKWMLRP